MEVTDLGTGLGMSLEKGKNKLTAVRQSTLQQRRRKMLQCKKGKELTTVRFTFSPLDPFSPRTPSAP